MMRFMERRGLWNFTQPSVITHNKILEMYKTYIDPNFTLASFTLEEQANLLQSTKSQGDVMAH